MDWFKSITKMPLILKGVQCWEVRQPSSLRPFWLKLLPY